ncbi:MAG TPA: multicopper oxidase family protein [Methylomirabilota bacterium]|nr:multicopper oxidase family protein [Methylomirabilota bacterium]
MREIALEARKVRWELAPGKLIDAMAYNGRVPGPEIRVKEGERVHVVLKNALDEPTTIHWHGVDVPNAMDGVPLITQKAVQPGETFAYEFEARPAGTRWYHTHFNEHHQMDLGLVAPLIVEPAAPEPFPADRDYTLVLDDWATGSAPAVPTTDAGTAGARGSMGGMMGGMRGMGGRGMMGGMMGRGGMGSMMGRGAHAPVYDTMTINGKAYPATERIVLERGERVRLRLINASAEHTHAIRLAGHPLHVTHTDGNTLQNPVEVDVLPIAPAERYDVLVHATRPGAWLLYCTAPGHAEAGEQVLVVYRGEEHRKPEPALLSLVGLRLWTYRLGRGRDALPRASGTVRSADQVLSGGMMGSEIWSINGKCYPDTDAIAARRGDVVRLGLRNNSMEAHPMHLHGQSFRVLAVNGERLATPLVKDTVDVEAHMGSTDIEFSAHNPGDWFFHCHKPMHMDGGMIALVKIAR